MINKKSVVTWYHMSIILLSQLAFIPFAKNIYSTDEFSLWLSLNLLIALYLIVDFGNSQTFLKCNGRLISGYNKIPSYGSINEDSKRDFQIKPKYCDLSYIAKFNNFVDYNFLRNAITTLFLLAISFFFLIRNRLDLLEYNPEYLISFLLALITVFVQAYNFFLFNKLISFKDYSKIRLIEANIVLLRVGFISISFYLNLSFVYYFIFFLLGSLILAIAHFSNFSTIKSIKFSNKNKFFSDSLIFTKGQKRQGLLNLSSALILNAVGLVGAQFQSSVDASLALLTNRVFNVIKNFSQVPLISNIPDLIISRNSLGFVKTYNKFINFHARSISLFIFFSIINYLFFYLVEQHYGASFIYLGGLYFLYFFILLLELNHSGFSQFYLTRNHIPFLIPSLISGICLILSGIYFGNIFGALGLILAQGIIQIMYNNWFPVYVVFKELKFEKNNYI